MKVDLHRLLKSDEEAIETILEAVKKAGYEPGKDFKIAMDAASSEWKSEKGKGYYKLPKAGTEYTSEELIEHWANTGARNIRSFPSKTVWMKKTGKDGRS